MGTKSDVVRRRKDWSEESMLAAENSVLHEDKSVREAARLYNVPFELYGDESREV